MLRLLCLLSGPCICSKCLLVTTNTHFQCSYMRALLHNLRMSHLNGTRLNVAEIHTKQFAVIASQNSGNTYI